MILLGDPPRGGAAAFMASDLVEFFSADSTTSLEAVRLIHGDRAAGVLGSGSASGIVSRP